MGKERLLSDIHMWLRSPSFPFLPFISHTDQILLLLLLLFSIKYFSCIWYQIHLINHNIININHNQSPLRSSLYLFRWLYYISLFFIFQWFFLWLISSFPKMLLILISISTSDINTLDMNDHMISLLAR